MGGPAWPTGNRRARTVGQDSAIPCITVRQKASGPPGRGPPLPADIPVNQTAPVGFTYLAVDILRGASAEVRTDRSSEADTACSEGTRADMAAVMEAAIRTVITISLIGNQKIGGRGYRSILKRALSAT